jgi:hypothetical protein
MTNSIDFCKGRYDQLGWVVFCLIMGMFPVGTHARGKKSTSYDGTVDFGAQLLHVGDGCFSVDGSVRAGDFFEDLERIDIASGSEFRKDGRVVTKYPESLTTSIRILGDQCAGAFSIAPSSIFNGDSYSLTFEVEWKDGVQLTPAVLSPAVAHCAASRIATNASKDSTFPAITCQMTVDSKGIPLANHLIVSVFAADGERLVRLSARP